MKTMKLFAAVSASALAGVAAPVAADVVTLNFEGIATSYPNDSNVGVLGFYNGGASSAGTTGTYYGVSFGVSAIAFCLNTLGATCSNVSRGGLGDPNSQRGGLWFRNDAQAFLNYSGGFTTGFSFYYSAIEEGGTIDVFDQPNGTGNILWRLTLPTTSSACSGFNASFCPFVAAGVAFQGTAMSIGFGGAARTVVFDDLTFGSATPGGAVPEPATWAMLIMGFGAIGGTLRRRSARIAFA